jgi:hypothetical protein
MGEDDAMVEEFFSEVNDKYSPQVMEGLGLLEAGDIPGGIEILARPLHTIKGVTGFMTGFEAASRFTHKVEDYLKKIQSGEVEPTEQNVTLLSLGVNMIFTVIEQIREQGAPDEAETTEMLELLRQASGPGGPTAAEAKARVEIEARDGIMVLRILARRIHLGPERDTLTRAVAAIPEGGRVLLDFSGVLTVGSAAWEALAALAEKREIAVTGLSFDCRSVFYSWGLDRALQAFASAEDYFQTACPPPPGQ